MSCTQSANHEAGQSHPCLCIINILPDELLSEIYSTATHTLDSDLARYRFPSVLCRVSRRWSRITSATPEIWAFIFIHDEPTLKHTLYRLARSGGVCLDIKICDPDGHLKPQEVLETLLPSCGRWTSLDMSIPKMEPYLPRFPRSLPLLRWLSFTSDSARFNLKTLLPRLRWMQLDCTYLCWDPSIEFGSLTEFHALGGENIRMPFSKLLDFLRNSPRLEILELRETWMFQALKTNESVEALLAQAIDLPNLRAMRLDPFYPWEFALLLSCTHTPSLQNLMLRLGPSLYQIPTLLHLDKLHLNLPSLRKFTFKQLGLPIIESKHLLAQMAGIHTLSIIEGGSTANFALATLMVDLSLAKMSSQIETIYLEGISLGHLQASLSQLSLEVSSHSFMRHAAWKIRLDGANSTPEDAIACEQLLDDLKFMIPNISIVEQGIQWD